MSEASEFIKMLSKNEERCLPVLMKALADEQYHDISGSIRLSHTENQERIDQLMNEKCLLSKTYNFFVFFSQIFYIFIVNDDHLDLTAKKSCLTDQNKKDIQVLWYYSCLIKNI